MHIHPFHPATGHHPSRTTIADQLAARLHASAAAGGIAVRFIALSVLACLFVSLPVTLREVPHASHRPSSGH